MSTLLALCLLAAQASSAPPAEIALREVDGDLLVDSVAAGVDPLELVRRLASAAGREVEGGELLAGRPRLDVNVAGRSLESVLDLLACATRTRIALGRRAITIAAERTTVDAAACRLDAEAAWVALVRDFPGHEAARIARVELGAMQERQGHEDAALTHYDAAVRDGAESPATERALAAAGDLLLRRSEWSEAMKRFSRLAQIADDEDAQVAARIAIARALSEQGRGAEALALVDVVDLTYPPRDPAERAERRLARARGHLAAGAAAEALLELDERAAADPRLGGRADDLALRARALEELGSPLEASRAWLACASIAAPAERADALFAAARLAAAGGDDLAVLFVERLAKDGARAAELARFAAAARERLGIGFDARDLTDLERRWNDRARLALRDRAALASDLVTATARERGAEAASTFARAAIAEVGESEARPVRSALANAWENEGAWAEAARVWGGQAP